MASVELSGVHKRFGDTHVVKGVDLNIVDGEFLVLVGPSGCGKSTCLRMIAGLETVSEGAVKIGGRVVNDVLPKDRDIGMVFQSYALYPHMTVRQNLEFGLRLRKTPADQIATRVGEAAKILAIEDLLERRPKALSGGQRQRVAMGRAIVRRPQVFLFDEPLSNLDAALRVQMRAELGALHRQLGTTMVYVTHDQIEAMTLATRIAVMNDGVMQQVGPALELYHRPANRFVAGFIGSPSMNFISGELGGRGLGLAFSAKGFVQPLSLNVVAPDSQVTLGIRPHEVTISTTPGLEGEGFLRGEVVVVEPMGWESYVHVDTGCGRIVVQTADASGIAIGRGDMVALSFDPARLYLFGEDGATVAFPERGSDG